jgi:hypothetical protein
MAEDLDNLCIPCVDSSKMSCYFDTFDIYRWISYQTMNKLSNTAKK